MDNLTLDELVILHDAILTHPILAGPEGDRLDQIGDKILTMILDSRDSDR